MRQNDALKEAEILKPPSSTRYNHLHPKSHYIPPETVMDTWRGHGRFAQMIRMSELTEERIISHVLRIRMGLFVRKMDTCIDISRKITRLILAGKDIRTDSSRRRKGSRANGLEARQIKRKEKRV